MTRRPSPPLSDEERRRLRARMELDEATRVAQEVSFPPPSDRISTMDLGYYSEATRQLYIERAKRVWEKVEGLEPEEDLKEDEEEDLWAELDDSPQSQRPSLQSQREGAPSPALVSSHPSLANQVLSEGLKAALDEEIRRDIANAQREMEAEFDRAMAQKVKAKEEEAKAKEAADAAKAKREEESKAEAAMAEGKEEEASEASAPAADSQLERPPPQRFLLLERAPPRLTRSEDALLRAVAAPRRDRAPPRMASGRRGMGTHCAQLRVLSLMAATSSRRRARHGRCGRPKHRRMVARRRLTATCRHAQSISSSIGGLVQ